MKRFPLQVGDRSPRVAEVRSILARLGLLDHFSQPLNAHPCPQWNISDELFDEELAKALRAFQQQRGIIADGMITAGTLRAVREASYTLGARLLRLQDPHLVGDDVVQLQMQLHDLGFYTNRVDGHFGKNTHAAVMSYQRNYALSVDGVVGEQTLKALSYLGRRITGGSAQTIHEREKIRSAGPLLAGKRVVLDPGLGACDKGYCVHGPFGDITEEDILWDLATRINTRMMTTGIETIMSRTRSANPTNEDRANIANAFGADLLISLRTDIYSNDKANGSACFYFGSLYGYSSMVGEKLAGYIQREIVARTPLRNCFNHGQTWDILRLTSMPTVQVVPGYLTNPGDVKILTDPAMRDTIAEAIVVAVKRLYLLDDDKHQTGTFSFRELLAYEIPAQ